MEPRFDDCDLDLRDDHAGVFPGARWNVTESAPATTVLSLLFVPALFFGMRILPVPRHVLFGFVTRKRTFNSCFPFCGKCAGSVACTRPGLFIWTDPFDLAL